MSDRDARGQEHPNALIVRSVIEGFRSGDITDFTTYAGPDVTWHFPGREGRLAGSHRGFDAVIGFLAQVVELTGGTFEMDLFDVVANDRRAIALFRGRGTREGRHLDNPTCLSMRFQEGRVVEVWEFVWDLYHVDAFWS
jgi:uncharacterized protein